MGKWKNISELEESLNLDELRALINAMREREHRANKFAAALKGIDLDAGAKEEAQERFDAVKRRVDSKLTGQSEETLSMTGLGLRFETDEDD